MDNIELDSDDLKFISRHMPAIQAGKRAEETVADYIRAIIRRSGGDPKRRYNVAGNKIVFAAAGQND